MHLDKCTLRLLTENERVASFSLDLRDRLSQAQDKSTATVKKKKSSVLDATILILVLNSRK